MCVVCHAITPAKLWIGGRRTLELATRCPRSRKYAGFAAVSLSVCRSEATRARLRGKGAWHSTRRTLLEQIGRAGGLGAAYLAMEALGLAIPTPAGAEHFELPPTTGRSVVILGAGIAGLVSAYELRRAGYAVTLLEARDRVGGRSWTVRGGDRIVHIGGEDQVARFDPGLYFNAGPARIPATHRVNIGLRAQVRDRPRDLRQRQPQRRLGLRRAGQSRTADDQRHARPPW